MPQRSLNDMPTALRQLVLEIESERQVIVQALENIAELSNRLRIVATDSQRLLGKD